MTLSEKSEHAIDIINAIRPEITPTMEELAACYGCTRQNIDRIEVAAMRKAMQKLQCFGVIPEILNSEQLRKPYVPPKTGLEFLKDESCVNELFKECSPIYTPGIIGHSRCIGHYSVSTECDKWLRKRGLFNEVASKASKNRRGTDE